MAQYTDSDITPALQAKAMLDLEAYAGDNAFLTSVRTNLQRYGKLSVKQARAVLNTLQSDRSYSVAQAFEVNDYMPYEDSAPVAVIAPVTEGRPTETEFGPIDYSMPTVQRAIAQAEKWGNPIDYTWLSVQSYPTPEERGRMSDQWCEIGQARFDMLTYAGKNGKRAIEYFNNARNRQMRGIMR